MDEKALEIQRGVIFDEAVSHYEVHAHQSYSTSSFNNNDEIRIAIQHQDLCLLPSKSSLHITGKLNAASGVNPKLSNMSICHMFEEIRYEVNGIAIDRSKNVGITTLMKGYVSLNPEQVNHLENAGWLVNDEKKLTNGAGNFDVSIPLSLLLGFAEDYRRIIVNAKHELILTRANTDSNALVHESGKNVKIQLDKIEWLIPYVTLSDSRKVQMLNYIAKDPPISMSFRTWELHDYPMLPETTKHVWAVKTSTQLEKPRYVILGFQTKRRDNSAADASQFDHCNVRDVKLFLNSQCYPYGNMNLDVGSNQYAVLYDMYASLQTSYYGEGVTVGKPMLSKNIFLEKAPLIVIDCSKQKESLKSGPVDVRLEIESHTRFPPQTAAYCLILHDRIAEYRPLSGQIRKIM